MSKIDANSLEQIIKERLEATHVEIEDISGGCGSSFSAFIVSPVFEGLKLLERQRLVMTKLQEEMKSIHAFTFKKCITPKQYEEQQNK
ncbi:hypothetical protein ABK040_003396 [Willaertia magna]